MYMPTLARFTARDPMPPDGEPVLLGRSTYEYADNNPVNEFDPSGLSPLILGPIPCVIPIIPCVSIKVGKCEVDPQIDRPPGGASDAELKRFRCRRGWKKIWHNNKDGDPIGVACVKCRNNIGDPCREVPLCPGAPTLGVSCEPFVLEDESRLRGVVIPGCACSYAQAGDLGVA